MKLKTVLAVLVSLYTIPSHAVSISDFLLSGQGTLGYSTSSAPSGSTAPTLVQAGVGLNAAYKVYGPFFAGVGSQFSFINQYTSVDAIIGNRRGTHWTIVQPVIGAQLLENKLIIQGSYEFLGNYYLGNTDSSGATITYTKPSGFQVSALYNVFDKVSAGLNYQTTSFSNQNSSINGDTTLSTSVNIWQAGLMLAYIY